MPHQERVRVAARWREARLLARPARTEWGNGAPRVSASGVRGGAPRSNRSDVMKITPFVSHLLALLLGAGFVAAATQQQAPQTRREPQFENEHVRVWKSIIMPNQPLALHRHEFGRTIVALRGGTLDVVGAKGETMKKMTWESGKAYWLGPDLPGEQHGDLNRGAEPIEVIVVEMRR